MKAIQLSAFGGPEVMSYLEVVDPKAAEGEVILDVTSIGINYADTHQTENTYLIQQMLPLIPGIEITGTHQGKRYLASVASGGYAQKAVADKNYLFPIPDAVTDEQALCMLVQGTTAWHLLKTMGNLKSGETLVIHAAAGGVGTLAIQLAKMWGGKVIAVTGTSKKAELAKSLGADEVILADSPELAKTLRAHNNGLGIDLILEMVGGTTFDQSLEALGNFGRVITYGLASRKMPNPVHPGSLVNASKTISGFWLANCFGKKELMHDVIAELFQLVSNGKLRPVIGKTYPLSEAAQAHREMLARETVGKITLDPAR